ncbi:MAG: SpoIIE family protein phosphatase [Bacteroidetes bacterium]|nr:SpoIIE family protein phosphatase [Bacteroidota bacterium]
MNHLPWTLRYSDTKRASEIAKDMLVEALGKEDQGDLAWAKLYTAITGFLLSNNEDIFQNLLDAYHEFQNRNEKTGLSRAALFLGYAYESFGDYSTAMEYAMGALAAADNIADDELLGDTHSLIGLINSRLSNFAEAILSYQKSLAFREKLNDKRAMASNYNLLARANLLKGDYSESEQFYIRAIDLRVAENDQGALPWSYLGIAGLFKKTSRYDEAEEYYMKSLIAIGDSGDKRVRFHIHAGLTDLCIQTGNTAKANDYLGVLQNLCNELDSKPLLLETHLLTSKYFEATGVSDQALEYYKLHHTLESELKSSETLNNISNLRTAHAIENAQKEAEIYQLKNVELKKVYDVIETHNKNITASITYAKHIQQAFLPPQHLIQKHLDDYFLLYHPKDIVSGDFYFVEEEGDQVFFTAVDCTGHGVPGAILSVIGYNFLRKAVKERKYARPAEILTFLDKAVHAMLRQGSNEIGVKDGMDIALCALNKATLELQFAGAFNPLYYISDNELHEVKADFLPIGQNDLTQDDTYTNHVIQLKKGDTVYLFSDGYADQFGGPKRKKFLYKRLRETLLQIQHLTMDKQKEELERIFFEWKGDVEQYDDVLILGVKITNYELRNKMVNDFSVILTGLFTYNAKEIQYEKLEQEFVPWQHRIFDGDYKGTFQYLSVSYYESYLRSIFPEINAEYDAESVRQGKHLVHLTSKALVGKPLNGDLLLVAGKTAFRIEFADLYLFPQGVGLFSLKLLIDHGSTLEEISSLLNKIRLLSTKIEIDQQESTIQTFCEEQFLNMLGVDAGWLKHNPQLKSCIQLDVNTELSEEEMDCLLFDIGNVSPLGSAKGEGMFAPSESYFRDQISENKICIFRNWSALSLFDTFTRISVNFPDKFKSWEYDYFNLYIYCIYLKFSMYITNANLTDVVNIDKRTRQIRDDFIELINDHYHTHISYKFLPDLIQDKLLNSLEVHSEIEKMETKIRRINEHAQEKRDKILNKVLITITLLSVFSVVADLSAWFVKLGVEENLMFPFGSLSIALLISAAIAFLFLKKRKA